MIYREDNYFHDNPFDKVKSFVLLFANNKDKNLTLFPYLLKCMVIFNWPKIKLNFLIYWFWSGRILPSPWVINCLYHTSYRFVQLALQK